MTTSPISEAVRDFLCDHINSVEQLEILLLLRDSPDRSWTAAEISRLLFTTEASVRARLLHLREHGLAEITSELGATRYQYCISDPRTDQTIWSLEHEYRRRKDAVIAIIFGPRVTAGSTNGHSS